MGSAAELMARQGLSLAQAATQLKVPLTSHEVEDIMKRELFQRLLRTARLKYYNELASDPDRTKRAAIGAYMLLFWKLYELGDYDKAGVILEKMTKLEGWLGIEGQVNVFAGLTQKDIDEMRAKLAEENATGTRPTGVEKARPN